MTKNHAVPPFCPVCRKPKSKGDLVHGDLVRAPIVERIKRELPDWKTSDPVCHACLRRVRADDMGEVLRSERPVSREQVNMCASGTAVSR